ncbi:kynurenine 3-monooxygenase [Methanobrevibacter cuticularis]|uniref:Kynurenine 3-monooxygenase n=1 Tax=Methanobrevibacter cuticularis TaxID=47311 RepID=A0A166E3T9_9EURY|nr:FAD-dependent oxidoreductase [Methanobrevibacter cuticularis]KZX16249.1 kynurenine 3-monooxygenase [Methanobrevibacter cuticularis]
MSFDYDVVIIGAGPIGSTLAYKIAKKGYSVAILEKKKEIGIPLQCAGIVSKKLKDINEIPDSLILNEVKGAYLHSLSHDLRVKKDKNEALIIDRIGYDKFLAKRAIDAGAILFKQSKVIAVDSKSGTILCQNNRKVKAKIIVGADGPKSIASDSFNHSFKYFNATQYLIEINNKHDDIGYSNNENVGYHSNENIGFHSNENIGFHSNENIGFHSNENIGFHSNENIGYHNNENVGYHNNEIVNEENKEFKKINKDSESIINNKTDNSNDFVDIFAISKILPGFLWCIPTTKNSYRIGLFSNNDYKNQKIILEDFLSTNEKFKNCSIVEKYNGKIPIFDKNKNLVTDRMILIGDAASQIKPTTGGGLILGFDICNLASDAIIKSLKDDDIHILKKYEKNFKKKYSKELSYQLKVQQTLEILSDDDLDHMFLKLKEKNAEEIISKYGDMDKQSVLVKEFIKRGIIFSIIPKAFFRKLISIWGFK